jgi:hypothetical protein
MLLHAANFYTRFYTENLLHREALPVARAPEIAVLKPKPDRGAKAKKDESEALFKRIFKGKIASAKPEKIC